MKTVIYNDRTKIILWSGDSDVYKSPDFDGQQAMATPGASLFIDVPEEIANIASLEVGTIFPGIDINSIPPVEGVPVETL